MASEAAKKLATLLADDVAYVGNEMTEDDFRTKLEEALESFAKRAVKGAFEIREEGNEWHGDWFQAAPQALPWSRTKQGAEEALSKFAEEVVNGLK